MNVDRRWCDYGSCRLLPETWVRVYYADGVSTLLELCEEHMTVMVDYLAKRSLEELNGPIRITWDWLAA